jgi:twitching motility protein PilT
MITMQDLLKKAVEQGATDLHITPGLPPEVRLDQRIVPLDHYDVINPELSKELTYSLLNPEQQDRFELEHELDFSFGIDGFARFRGNAFMERGNVACAIRYLPSEIPTIEEIGLPPIVDELATRSRGLVLVVGPTGSGKSTTLAAMIDKVNSERPCHIITIEDPIEYIYKHRKAIVQQRELGQDTDSFARALKFALRQDPDVLLVGEMRDLETIAAVLTAAETGHLVLSTLHTDSTTESINRIIDVFPPHQQRQVRAQLSLTLEAIIGQRLLPKANERGLILGFELMIATPAIRALIRENRLHEIYGMIQAGKKHGMRTMNMCLFDFAQWGVITWEEAMLASSDPQELQRMKERK